MRAIWFVIGWLMLFGAYYNAREAHRHAHELACHVGAAELCAFHEPQP